MYHDYITDDGQHAVLPSEKDCYQAGEMQQALMMPASSHDHQC
jgi:hypothetical protein